MSQLQVDETTLDVTELPVRKWTQDYKEFLEGLIKPEEKAGPAVLADYREHHSDADVHFSLQLLPGQMEPCFGRRPAFQVQAAQSKISCGSALPHYKLKSVLDPMCRFAFKLTVVKPCHLPMYLRLRITKHVKLRYQKPYHLKRVLSIWEQEI